VLRTLREFPPRQEPATFSVDTVTEKLQAGHLQRVRSRRAPQPTEASSTV
jgi:hypothetical protein